MLRRIWAVLAAGLVCVGVFVHPANASAAAGRSQGQCEAGICRFELDLGLSSADLPPQGAWLDVAEAAAQWLPGGSTVAVSSGQAGGPVTLQLPSGPLQLADADFALELDEAGRVAAMQGSAMLPAPTLGLLGDAPLVTPTRVGVGYATGADLSHLDAPLDAGRRYLYFDAQAGMQVALGEGPTASLSGLPGQRLTFIVDALQPVVYIDGQLTLRTDGQLAFVREALGPVGDGGWLPEELPVLQTAALHVQAQAGRGVEPKLALDGSYRMESGLVGRWLQLDATPIVAEGQAVLSPMGLLVSGEAHSNLGPAQFLAAGSRVDVFLPFSVDESLTAGWSADIALPQWQFDAQTSQQYTQEPGALTSLPQSTWQSMQQGAGWAASVAQNGYGRLTDGAASGMAHSRRRWCEMTGFCPAAAAGTAGNAAVDGSAPVSVAQGQRAE